MYGGTLNNCMLSRNSAWNGGGACDGTLNNCTLSGNSAWNGGGADDCTLNNCALSGNSADQGGGAFGGTLNNCTLIGNSASDGGGAMACTLNNCIVYFNSAPQEANYDFWSTLNYCCTTPLPTGGAGNISLDPQLASNSHLSAFSPCIGKGNYALVSGVDIDGETWANPSSIGCDEYHPGAVSGPLSVGLAADFMNVAVGYPVNLTALIEGRTDLSVWVFDDGTVELNQFHTTHAWAAPGNYQVVLWAFSDSHPEGVSATVTIQVVAQPTHYVAPDSPNPVLPYLSWATAARNIQDAVDAASLPGALVLVTNGTYDAGGRAVYRWMTNRVTVDKPVVVQSINGPQFTVIQGHQVPHFTNGFGAVRCVYLTSGASLSGFTLTNGATLSGTDGPDQSSGGGVWCASATAVVSNCVIAGNSASYAGGGASGGSLDNCTLSGNRASSKGGGAFKVTLNNSTLNGNSAYQGGGAYWSTLNNSTLTGNSAGSEGGGATYCTFNNSTLTRNSAYYGGGAYWSTLNNCVLTGNLADSGGGAEGGTLNNCVLSGNRASSEGGGAGYCSLNNCTLSANLASSGGGATDCRLNNCIVYFNSSPRGANYDHWSTLNYCCTSPMPTNGVGNISNAPLFVDSAGGNLRLQSNSPCINAGLNDYVLSDTDRDGRPRILGGTVDIGAYEYQGPGMSEFIGWLQRYRLPADGSADYTDADGDGMNNWQEWRCLTDPTNSLSALKMLTPSNAVSGVTLCWQSVAGVRYSLERSTNLSPPMFFTPLATAIPGQPGTTAYTDTTAIGAGPFFYRVGVQ